MANIDEQVNTQKRKDLLSTLLEIIEKKKHDGAVDSEASYEFVDTLSASSARKHIASSENTVPTRSSSSKAYRSDTKTKQSTEHEVKSMVEEPDWCDEINMSSPRESPVESERNASSSPNCKQHKQPLEDVPLHLTAFNRHLPPQVTQGIKRKFHLQSQVSHSDKRKVSVNDKSQLAPRPSSAGENKRRVHLLYHEEARVNFEREQPTECESERSCEELASKPDDQQVFVQKPENKKQDVYPQSSIQDQENKVVVLEADVKESSSVMTAEIDHLGDKEDPFAFYPPRKVRLKFRGGTSKACGDSTETSTLLVTDAVSSPAKNKNSYSPSPNSKQHKYLSEDTAEYYRCSKTDNKPPLLGHSPVASKRHSQPLMSKILKSKFSSFRRSLLRPSESSASGNERAMSKYTNEPSLHVGAQTGLSTRPDRNYHSHCRDKKTYLQSPAESCHDRKFKQVEGRIHRLKKSNNVPQDQHSPRFERERGFKVESLWHRSSGEVLWQERDDATWIEENTQIKREYHGNEPLQEERITDLRQKLNYHRQHMNRHYRDAETCRPGLHDRFDDGRQCLLRAPPQLRYSGIKDEYDVCHNVHSDSPRRHSSGLLRDSLAPQPDDMFLQDDDDHLWTSVDRQRWEQSREYITSSPDEAPRHREVRNYSCLSTQSD